MAFMMVVFAAYLGSAIAVIGGTVALVLGMLFFNLYLFAWIRRRTLMPEAPGPVAPVGRSFRDRQGTPQLREGGIRA